MTVHSTSTTVEWPFERILTAPKVEQWVATLPPDTKKVMIRLGAWQRSGPFADARLQSALCLLHRRGIETAATVPPITLTGDRADIAFADPDSSRTMPHLTPTERKLAGSLAGLSIGQLCKFDREHDHISSLQRQTLRRRRYLFGWGDEIALAVPSDARETGVPRQSPFDRQAIFNKRLQDLLHPLGVTITSASPATLHWFNELKTFAFEATENTWDHGRLDFNLRPIHSLRFVRLRRIDIGERGFDLAEVAPGFEESFSQYLNALRTAGSFRTRRNRETTRFVEVTIADGGVGVAARMAGSLDVYLESREEETLHLLNALLPDGTTKSPSEPGRGQGFRKMLTACYNLSGMTIVRTGRLKAIKTYLRQDDESEEIPDFGHQSSSAYKPDLSETLHPLLAGTSISLIFPVVQSAFRRSRGL